MTVFHRLVGYDKTTERVAVEFAIPPHKLEFAKRIAGVAPDDPEAVFCYGLTAEQAGEIAWAIEATIDARASDFFMEGYSEPLSSAA